MGFLTARKIAARAGKGVATKQIGLYENMARWIARGIQLIFALIIVGMYGHRVDEDRQESHLQSAAWMYGTVVAGASAITAVVYCIPFVPVYRLWVVDAVLSVGWLVVFGVFAGIFLHRESGTDYEGTSVRLMKVAVWIDLVNVLLWMATTGWGVFRTFLSKKAKHFENKIDNKLDCLEEQAMGKISEKLPRRMDPAHIV
jgi:hypothetical protein